MTDYNKDIDKINELIEIKNKYDRIKNILNNCTFMPYSEDSKVNIYQAMNEIRLIIKQG